MSARGWLRWTATLTSLAVVEAIVACAGRDALAPPPLSAGGARAWLQQHDVATAAFALVRVCGLVMGGYLLAALLLGAAARMVGNGAAARLVDRLTVPGARHLVAAMGFGSVGIIVGSPPPRVPPAPAGATAVVRDLGAAPSPGGPSVDVAVIRALPDRGGDTRAPTADATADATGDEPRPATPRAEAPPPTPSPAPPPDANGLEQWPVQPGESMWSIAASHLADIRGRAVSDVEVASYWRAVVAVNALPNPDLIFVGQSIALPPVPG